MAQRPTRQSIIAVGPPCEIQAGMVPLRLRPICSHPNLSHQANPHHLLPDTYRADIRPSPRKRLGPLKSWAVGRDPYTPTNPHPGVPDVPLECWLPSRHTCPVTTPRPAATPGSVTTTGSNTTKLGGNTAMRSRHTSGQAPRLTPHRCAVTPPHPAASPRHEARPTHHYRWWSNPLGGTRCVSKSTE